MSGILVDTHALVWLLAGSSRLGQSARQGLERAAREATVLVSAITPLEIAMLVAKGRLTLNRDVGEWVTQALALPGIRLAPLAPEIAVASTRLPGELHGDPSDRILVATARHHGVPLLTADEALLHYAGQGHLVALRAGD